MGPVHRQSVHLKTLFFLFYVGLGISSPYFGIFYKHVIVHADGTPADPRHWWNEGNLSGLGGATVQGGSHRVSFTFSRPARPGRRG